MNVKCQACKAKSELHLCSDCQGFVEEALESLPGLLYELEVTRTRQDRLTVGGVGKSAETASPINVGAMELNREVAETLADWTAVVETLGPRFLPSLAVSTGFVGPLRPGWRRLPRGYSATAVQRARWLSRHVAVMAKHPQAGQFYKDITDLAGDPDKPTKPGRLLRAIDKQNRTYAGQCPTVRGRTRQGDDVLCDNNLKAIVGDAEVTCPRCQQTVNVQENLLKAKTARDLMPEETLLETMETMGEKISRVKLYDWKREGRVHPRGYLHHGTVVEKRIHKTDPRLFSLSQCRALRAQDQARAEQAAAV